MRKIITKIKKFFGIVLAEVKGDIGYDTLIMNVTSKCNSNCRYCDVHSLDHSKDMDTARMKRLIEEAKENGFKEVFLSGGEPFVNQDIWEIIDFSFEKGMETQIVTNGLTLNYFSEEQMKILSKLKGLSVSLDSHDSKIHNYLRGSDSFGKTVLGIKKCVQGGVKVTIAPVISNENYKSLERLIDLAKELGVASIVFQPLHVWSNFNHNDDQADADNFKVSNSIKKTIRESMNYAKSLGIYTNLPAIVEWIDLYFTHQEKRGGAWINKILPNYKCPQINTKLFIHSDGSLLPCAMLSAEANVKELSLEEGMDKMKAIKEAIRKGSFPKGCNKCSCQVSSNYVYSVTTSPIRNFKQLIIFIKDSL